MKNGLVLICIDGLSYSVFQYALQRGYCPFLKDLVQAHKYILYPYFCGLPAVTTASEAALFYGDNYDIPAFSWFDRTAMQFIRSSYGNRIGIIEKRLGKKYPHGLLENGSCYFGAFSGGATFSDYSADAFDITHPWSLLEKLRILTRTRKAPLSIVRNIKQLLKKIVTGRKIKGAVMHHIMGNLATYIARQDIQKGTPSLFIDYPHYDDCAHMYGNIHHRALEAITQIDEYIRKLFTTDMDVVILSDHGQTDASFIQEACGTSIDEVVRSAFSNNTKRVIRTLGTYSVKTTDFQKDVFVIPSGGIAHIYFAERFLHPYKKEELEKKYPLFLKRLLEDQSIGWLLVRISDTEGMLMGKEGSIFFKRGCEPVEEGNPLPVSLPYRSNIISSLSFYSTYFNNGDIVLFSNVFNHTVIDFEKAVSVHGGFLGSMVEPFIMVPASHPINSNSTITLDIIHRYLMTLHLSLI